MTTNEPESSQATTTGPSIPAPAARLLRRRWLRFSLRTMLVVITVLSIWLGVKVDQARRQKRAVEILRALGAQIGYEHQRAPSGWFDNRIELDVPAWARELAGDDFFQTVTAVNFSGRLNEARTKTIPYNITDEDLGCLADLPYLEQITINDAPISDAGLAHIRYPERLRLVELMDTDIGDDFVRRLRFAKKLEVLELNGTKVTDAGFAEFGEMTALKSLGLVNTDTGDAALAPFGGCRRLEILRLGRKAADKALRQFESLDTIDALTAEGAQITGEAFRGLRLPVVDCVHLRRCAIGDDDLQPLVQAVRDVRVLILHGCAVSDAGLPHLSGLGKTEILILSNTQVRGRELRHLASLPGIQWISLRGCPLDDADLKSLEPLYAGKAPGMNLSLDKTPIGDPDLAKISGFTNLTHLTLSATLISDDGLSYLYALKKLAVLDLRGTQVTAAGVKQLKQAIRGVMVAWDGDPRPSGWPW